MAHGKTKAKVHTSFARRIEDLAEKARKIADYFKTINSACPWNVPPTLKNTLNVPGLHKDTWDRNDINQNYCQDVLTGDLETCGTCGDLIALNWQADFMSVEERAFRTRHATYTRCAAMAHGRLHYHGDQGGVFMFLKEGVASAIQLGGRTG
jgi:hypothetical protein